MAKRPEELAKVRADLQGVGLRDQDYCPAYSAARSRKPTWVRPVGLNPPSRAGRASRKGGYLYRRLFPLLPSLSLDSQESRCLLSLMGAGLNAFGISRSVVRSHSPAPAFAEAKAARHSFSEDGQPHMHPLRLASHPTLRVIRRVRSTRGGELLCPQ